MRREPSLTNRSRFVILFKVTPPGPAKQFDKEATLEKAMHVFWQHGFSGTSLSQLLAEMGIGKKSLYDTYGNKRELFLQALDLYAEQSYRSVKEKLERPGRSLDNVRTLFEAFASTECKGCFYGTNIADFDLQDEDVAKKMCGHLKRFEETLADCLRRGQEDGSVTRECDAREMAYMLSCLSQGTALVSRVGECPGRHQKAMKAALELVEKKDSAS